MARVSDLIELSVIKQMELLAAKKPGVVSLAQGIHSFDTPQAIKRKVIDALQEGRVAKYSLSPGMPELREYIEESLERDGMFYDFETEIVVTAGSIEAIVATMLALLEPQDEVIIASPSYTSYVQAIRIAHGVPIFVPLNEEGGWSLDPSVIEKFITKKTRAILLCNPNNPTGTVLSRENLLHIANLAERYDLTIVTDEVYKDFIFDETARRQYFTLASVSELRKRVVRVFSFSKIYSMTGWRIAYLHTDQILAQTILKIHDSLVTCAPVISQYAAMAALEMKHLEIQEYLAEYDTRRRLLCEELDRFNAYLSYVNPVATYFVFPKLRTSAFPQYKNSLALAHDLLDRAKLAVVPGIAFGPHGEDHIRLSFGRSRDDILEGLRRLGSYFENVCG